MSKTSKTLLIIGGVLVVFVLVGIIAVALLADSIGRPSVPENSVLVLNISGDLPDYVPEEPLAKAFGVSQTQSFTSLLTQIRKAKVDNRIGAVLLDINFPGIGWGKADELRDAIADLRKRWKTVFGIRARADTYLTWRGRSSSPPSIWTFTGVSRNVAK